MPVAASMACAALQHRTCSSAFGSGRQGKLTYRQSKAGRTLRAARQGGCCGRTQGGTHHAQPALPGQRLLQRRGGARLAQDIVQGPPARQAHGGAQSLMAPWHSRCPALP